MSAHDDDSSVENIDMTSDNYVSWERIYEKVEEGKLILCELKTMIDEHIVASLLYWEKITSTKWYCVQVIKTETISEAKRCLVLEIKNDAGDYEVKYFVAHELGDVYFVEDFEFTRRSKARLSKIPLVGAKVGTDV